MRSAIIQGLAILCLTFMGACGKSSTDSTTGEATASTGTLALSIVGTQQVASASEGSALALQEDFGFYRPTAIASGAPTYFSVDITEIRLAGQDPSTGNFISLKILDEPEGKPLLLQNGNVDISNLFSSYTCVLSDGVPIDVGADCPCGIYEDDESIVEKVISEETGLEVCPYEGENGRVIINPLFAVDAPPAVYDTLSITLKSNAKMSGCVSADFSVLSADPGEHEYCTLAAHALGGTTTPQPSEFEIEPSAAEVATVPLSKIYPGSDELFYSFTITDGLELAVGETAPMSLVVDTNRVLRFYNMGRTDEGPNPGYPTDYAYFFSTVFDQSFYGFAGRTGDIRGYQWIAKHCDSLEDCTSITDDSQLAIIQGWMTVIYDSNDQPLISSFMPDDDNALTIIKGANMDSTGPKPEAFTKSGTVYDITMGLSDKEATIEGVNLDLDVGASQNTTFVGLDGVRGNITIIRKL